MDSVATVSIVVRLLARYLPWLIIRYFPQEKLDKLIEIHPAPTGEAVDIYYPDRKATCWLHVINLTPFTLHIDRLEITIVADGLGVIVKHIIPEVILSLAKGKIFCRDSFDASPHAMAHAQKSTKLRLEVRGFVTCSARSFVFNRHFDDLRGFRILP